MKGIYLGAYKALHESYDIDYQDINGLRDIGGDMLAIDLEKYDFIIATPPCNWWSRANYRRETSEYSIRTKLLLPCILFKLTLLGKPFIIENVLNKKQFHIYGLDNLPGVNMFKIGRHTYWSNIYFYYEDIVQIPKIEIRDGKRIYWSSQQLGKRTRQGTDEVHEVIERFLKEIKYAWFS